MGSDEAAAKVAAASQVRSGIAGSPLDALFGVLDRMQAELLSALTAAPRLPGDIRRVLPDSFGETLAPLWRLGVVCIAAIAVYLLTRRLTRHLREKAVHAADAFVGLLKMVGLELLALLVASAVSRGLLVRWIGRTPGAADFSGDLAIGLIRWLAGVTIAMIVFQPYAARFRLVNVDDRGARKAVLWSAILLAAGHLGNLLVESARRADMPVASAKLLSCLVALGMTVFAIRLLLSLGRNGLGPAIRTAAICLVCLAFALWVWGWVTLDFRSFRGAVGTIVVMLVTIALDRAMAVSIVNTKRPRAARRLFVGRVVVGAFGAAIVVRIVVEYWLVGAFGVLSTTDWPAFSRRLTFASWLLIAGATLAALVHVWTQATLSSTRSTPGDTNAIARLARLTTVLPIVRIAVISSIAVIFSLTALSTIGVDVTPLMAGVGILGLAVSFGSESLVKDVVAGIFYMVDDVFRIGETIETNGRLGRLENIGMRSVRLRDGEGRLHTIPMGSLGTVTNHSRKLERVRISAPLSKPPADADVLQFCREMAAALRADPKIGAAIVGDVSPHLIAVDDPGKGAIVFEFAMGSSDGRDVQAAIGPIASAVLQAARIEGLGREATVSTKGVQTLLETGAPGVPEMNMA